MHDYLYIKTDIRNSMDTVITITVIYRLKLNYQEIIISMR